MSGFDDEQQPRPTVGGVERESEPRLLTRSLPTENSETKRRAGNKIRPEPTPGQHAPKRGLTAWAGALWQRPRTIRSGEEQAGAPTRTASTRTATTPAAETPAAEISTARTQTAKIRHRVLGAMAGVLALVCVGLLLWLASLRSAVNQALPRLDGEAKLSGLQSAVTVTRDAQGVPRITAASLHDALFAQGYVTATDRLWQMDALRRHGAGELAEILGPSMAEHDRRQRILQMRAAADRAVTQLPPDQRLQLEAYAAGVNSFIDGHRGTLPVEFRLLAYKPLPWTPRDSLLILLAMFQDMSTRFPQKMDREAFSAHLPAALLPDLYPVGSWRDHPPAAQGGSLSAPHAVELIPLDPSQARAAPSAPVPPGVQTQELLAVRQELASTAAPASCPDCRAGSNNWVVSGERTVSGKPLLANDTHLNLSIPDAWYEVALRTTAPVEVPGGGVPGAASGPLDVSGFTLPGLPFVTIGRNPHVAWGLTNMGADVQDVRVEHMRGTGAATEFQRTDGGWARVEHHAERIRVRGGTDRVLDVQTTTHTVGAETMVTPIISGLYPSDPRTLSLAWTAFAPKAVTVPLLAANAAANGTALVEAFATFGGPSLNLVWADTEGGIGYHAIGLIPVRGSTTRQPRDVPEAMPLPPSGPPVPDGGEGEGATLQQPALTQGQHGAPRLLLTAYRPLRRHAGGQARRGAVPRPWGRRAGGQRAGGRRSRRGAAAPSASQTPPEPSPTPLLNYTIGSRVAPVPVDALDATQAWVGYIAYADMPAVTDPPGGVLVTANSRVTPDDYPWSVTEDWTDPFRTERILHLLRGRTGLTPSDMLAAENDVYSDVNQAMGQRLAYAIDHASAGALGRDAGRLHQAADILRGWDGEMTTGSAGAALVAAVREALWPALLGPQLAAHAANLSGNGKTLSAAELASLVELYNWGERTTALELLVGNQPVRWLPSRFATWNDFLATATEDGLKAAGAPADLRRWRYGKLHTVELVHPVFGPHPLLARLLGIAGSTGRQPAPGDFTTVKAIGPHFGPSERFIADLSKDMTSWHAALGNLTTGESENGHSPWYLDQFAPWMAGTTFALPGGETPATHTLRLVPAGKTL